MSIFNWNFASNSISILFSYSTLKILFSLVVISGPASISILQFSTSPWIFIKFKNQLRLMFWILVRDSIILIFFLFFYQGLFSPDSSHSMTDQSHMCNSDLSSFNHTLFAWQLSFVFTICLFPTYFHLLFSCFLQFYTFSSPSSHFCFCIFSLRIYHTYPRLSLPYKFIRY